MKTKLITIAAIIISCTISATAQETLRFDKIKIATNGKVEIKQGPEHSITSEEGVVSGNAYTISNDGWLNVNGNATDELTVTMPDLKKIVISGSGKVESDGMIKAGDIDLVVSGIGKVELNLECNTVNCDISGAGKIELEGSGNVMNVNISGSGKISAERFQVKNVNAAISGSGKCIVDVKDSLMTNISGTGAVYYNTTPGYLNDRSSGVGKVGKVGAASSDTTRISIGKTEVIIIEPGGEIKINPSGKLRPHWAGFELGINMLMDKDFSTDPPAGYDFLEPKIEKSVAVNFNLFDIGMPITADRRLMLVSGLGYSVNNFRFKSNALFVPDSDSMVVIDDGTDYKKNKLVVNYITVPLLLEFNTSTNPKNTFHVSAGVIGALRIGSHQKLVRETGSQDYKIKTYDDFNIRPFKADATFRMGYRNFTLFGTYSLVTLFKDGKGPEVYPFTVGVRLIGW